MKRFLEGKDLIDFTMQTASGSLPNYISSYHDDFVPMNVNYSIFEPLVLEKRVKKGDRKKMYSDRALEKLDEIMRKLND